MGAKGGQSLRCWLKRGIIVVAGLVFLPRFSSPVFASPLLWSNESTEQTGIPLISGSSWRRAGVSFVTNSSKYIDQVDLKVYKLGNIPGNSWVCIYSDGISAPATSLGCSDNLEFSSVPLTTWGWVTYYFSVPVEITSDFYWLVVDTDQPVNSSYAYYIGLNGTQVSNAHDAKRAHYLSPDSWATFQDSRWGMFRVYGADAPTPTPTPPTPTLTSTPSVTPTNIPPTPSATPTATPSGVLLDQEFKDGFYALGVIVSLTGGLLAYRLVHRVEK